MNQIEQLEKLNITFKNFNGMKFEYIKAISDLKQNEPERDGTDYEDENGNLIEVSKSHLQWENSLSDFQSGLAFAKQKIRDTYIKISALEEELTA